MSLVVLHFERDQLSRLILVLENDGDHVLMEIIEVPSDQLDWFPREPCQ